MNTEKLKRIRAHCVELLAIAEKRTPGKWTWGMRYVNCPPGYREIAMIPHGRECPHGDEWVENAGFIASCAGPAEAGWKATIAAIDGLLAAESLIYSVQNDYDDSPTRWWIEKRTKVFEAQNEIIAAWPEELLLNQNHNESLSLNE